MVRSMTLVALGNAMMAIVFVEEGARNNKNGLKPDNLSNFSPLKKHLMQVFSTQRHHFEFPGVAASIVAAALAPILSGRLTKKSMPVFSSSQSIDFAQSVV